MSGRDLWLVFALMLAAILVAVALPVLLAVSLLSAKPTPVRLDCPKVIAISAEASR